MFFNNEIDDSLHRLGERLRAQRLARNDNQADFSARLGVSVPTLRDMESGAPTVSIGVWLAALWMLDRLPDVDGLIAGASLFAEPVQRQRARRKRAQAV